MVTRTKKIFVGGLSANTVVEDVKQYFEQFGKLQFGFIQPESSFQASALLQSVHCASCVLARIRVGFVPWGTFTLRGHRPERDLRET
ncbi:RNA-binding protein Musashi homolog 2-like isoform X1 [Tachysurus ichikawai]